MHTIALCKSLEEKSDLVLQIHDESDLLSSHSPLSDCWLQPCFEDRLLPDLTERRLAAVRNQESQEPSTGVGAESWTSLSMGKVLRAGLSWWSSHCRNRAIPAQLQPSQPWVSLVNCCPYLCSAIKDEGS